MKILSSPLLQVMIILCISGCARDRGIPDYNGFPEEVGKILVNKCANSGCHNSVSCDGAAGLDLSSWGALFKGSRNNSSVIPYRPDQSFLLFSVNTYHDLGPMLEPVMPFNMPSLSREEVVTLRSWIANGAPDVNGNVKFEDNPGRSKIYVANQGCDLVTVFDASTQLAMRCIDVGKQQGIDSPHDMFVSPDGNNLYVSFYNNSIFQCYGTSSGSFEGEIDLGNLGWHSMTISGDSRYALVTHLNSDGKVALIDLDNMSVVIKYQGSGLFVFPHGCTLNYNGTVAYITSQQGNFIYKADLSDPMAPDITQVPLQPGDVPSYNGIHKPYEVDFSPDYSKYYVTCQGTNEVRVFDSSNDSLLSIIPTSGVPQLMSFSIEMPYLFITCMEDSSNAATTSSVNVINYQSHSLIKTLFTGYQPRGLAVDDANNTVYVANRNISPTGWAPHHTTACAGRNGYITLIDMNTLSMKEDWRAEVGVDPYSVAIRK